MSESVRAVERALDILLCFSRQTPELSMTQIAEHIGIHKSTVHRLLATLEGKRFVQRNPETGIYRLGIRVMQMAYLTLEQNDLRQIVAPFMQNLLQQYQENIHLAVFDDPDVVFVSIIESPQRVKLAAAVGQRLPSYATASGKAILAFIGDDLVWRIIKHGMHKFTQNTHPTPEALFDDLRLIRKQGYAISEQEYEEEINAIAAPIFDRDNQPVGSLAVAGPAYRLTRERMIEISPVVVTTTREISREIKNTAFPT